MPFLNAPLRLHDVDDVEALLSRAISRSGSAAGLRPQEREDLFSHLLEVAYRASLRFKPGPASFATYVYVEAQRGIVGYFRKTRGRTVWKFGHGRIHIRKLPEFVSLDAEFDSLGDTLAENGSDLETDRLEDDRGLFAERDRYRAEDLAYLGNEEAC